MAKKKAKPDFSKPKENNQTAQENKKNSFDDLENQPDFIENLVSSEITVAPDGTVTVTGEASAENAEYEGLPVVVIAGRPNVGKSTLISVVSQAKPVIADYHFTTITPVLGVVCRHENSSFVMADIPGLIEGAGEGLGLGHQFLRHVERCRLLVHVVDVSGSEGRDPMQDFEVINRELKCFNEELAERPMIVAGNKCDLATDEQVERFKNYVESNG